jgi:hypothetical protein
MIGKSADPSDFLARKKREVILATQRSKGPYFQIDNKSMGFDNGVMEVFGRHGLDTYFLPPIQTSTPTITFVSYTSPNATLAYTTGGNTITEYGFMVGTTKYRITNGSNILKLTDYLFPTPPDLSQAFVVSAYLVYNGITIQSASRIVTLSILINLVTTTYGTGIDNDGRLYGIYGGDYIPSEIGTSSQISSGMIYTSIGLSIGEQTFIDNQLVNLLMGQPPVTAHPYVKINGNYYISEDSAVFNWNSYVRFTLSVNSTGLITYTLNTDNFGVVGDVILHITSTNGTETTTLQVPGTSVIDYVHDTIVNLNATANIGTTSSINNNSPGINVTTESLEYNIETHLNINFRQEGSDFIYSLSPQFSQYINVGDSYIEDGWGTRITGHQTVNFSVFQQGHDTYDVSAYIHFVSSYLDYFIYRTVGYAP